MTNWWNEIHEEEGWFADYIFNGEQEIRKDKKVKDDAPGFCRVCGTRTGLHGFSFERKDG